MISLTRGQSRRRWLASLITLLAIMPWWMWVGSVLTSDDGAVFVKNDGAADEDCDVDCCTTCLCGESDACSQCEGLTPAQWAVTFLGVENGAPCTDCAAFAEGTYQGGTGTLGTYTVFQVLPCKWITSPGLVGPTWKNDALTFSGNCASATTFSDLSVQLDKGVGGYGLFASAGGGSGSTGLWFYSTNTSGQDCCSVQNFTSVLTSYVCNPGYISANYTLGINGTAVATPCG